MKKFWILTFPVLFLLTCCSGVIPGSNRDLTYEQVQLYAQQTLTAQAGVPADSFDPGALLIRPAATEAPASSGLTIISTPETDDVITRPVYNIPTAAPTAIPTATPLILQNPQYQQPEPVYSTPNYAQQVNTVCDRLRFIDDITIPDDTVMAPGQIFRKTWRIQNAGSCTWTAGYQLVYFSGDSLGETYAVNLPQAVAPGDTIDVSVDMTAPRRYGTFQSNWKLRSPSGNVEVDDAACQVGLALRLDADLLLPLMGTVVIVAGQAQFPRVERTVIDAVVEIEQVGLVAVDYLHRAQLPLVQKDIALRMTTFLSGFIDNGLSCSSTHGGRHGLRSHAALGSGLLWRTK